MEIASENSSEPPCDGGLDAPTVAPRADLKSNESIGSGTLIDDYLIEREIARGAMGVVYLATHRGLQRTVALKMILDAPGQTEIVRKRFENEARAAASLDHANIVPVHDVGNYRGYPYFTMAFIDGDSLATRLADGPLMPNVAATVAEQVAYAAAHAHAHSIIHRDLKPANILLDRSGVPHVTDFGVSKSLELNCDLTSSGEVIGTPHYMPPEQAAGRDDSVLPAADVYSIGAILYAMLTGRPPFQAATPVEVIAQVMTAEPVPPSKLNAGIPRDLETITLKCLCKSPRDRYVTAAQLGADLRRFLDGQPIVARPPGLIRRAAYLAGRHLMWASVSGSAALLLVVLSSVVMWSLVRAQYRIMDLEDELAAARQTVDSERGARTLGP